MARALITLARAEELPGCGNRIRFLRARTKVEQARVAIATGGDQASAREDLEWVLGLYDSEEANVPDNAPWRELLSDAEQLRAQITSN